MTDGLDRYRRRTTPAYYREYYDGAAFDVILVGGQPAGRLYVARWTDEIRTVRHRAAAGLLQPRHRFCLRATAGKLLRLHVERFNPALRLYERLGFREIEDKGVYLFMEWSSSGSDFT